MTDIRTVSANLSPSAPDRFVVVDRTRYLALSVTLVGIALGLDAMAGLLPPAPAWFASHAVPIAYGSLSFELQCRRARDVGWGTGYVLCSCLLLMLAVFAFSYGMFGPSSGLPHSPLGTASGILFVALYVGSQIALFVTPGQEE